MSVPAKRRSRSETRRRRSHHALKAIKLAKCPKCGRSVLPHTACLFCGTYNGRVAVKVKVKTKKAKKE